MDSLVFGRRYTGRHYVAAIHRLKVAGIRRVLQPKSRNAERTTGFLMYLFTLRLGPGKELVFISRLNSLTWRNCLAVSGQGIFRSSPSR